MSWPIRVPMQGRVPNFPVGTEGIVHVGDDQFNKVRRLSESGTVGNGSIVLLIPEDRHDARHAIYDEASRLYNRSIMAGTRSESTWLSRADLPSGSRQERGSAWLSSAGAGGHTCLVTDVCFGTLRSCRKITLSIY